jgi:putative methyltransferase
MPAYCLNPPQGAICIDACSAPGNKTSHLASITSNSTIFAFDLSEKRLQRKLNRIATVVAMLLHPDIVMESMLRKAGATGVQCIHQDFLSVQPADPAYAAVTHILCDPSVGVPCSTMLDNVVDHAFLLVLRFWHHLASRSSSCKAEGDG